MSTEPEVREQTKVEKEEVAVKEAETTKPAEENEESDDEPFEPLGEKEIAKKYEEGKAFFNDEKYGDATDNFSSVLEQLCHKYGDTALECAEAYYFYGRSMFLQVKSDALFGAKKPEPDSDDDSDGEPSAPDGSQSIEAAKQEEIENTQIAWETLEVARLIYERYPEKAPELSDVRYSLAEIFLETDNTEGAIEEFQKCLTLREQIFAPNDRRIAAAHYHLGLTYFSANLPTEAHLHYTKASEVLASKLESLEPNCEEAEDIKSILRDLATKMEEVDPALLKKEAEAIADTSNGKGKQAAAPIPTTSSVLPKEEIGFAKPIFDQNTQPVTKFGVVGKSVKRMTPVTVAPASSSSSSSSSSSTPSSSSSPSTPASSSSSSSSSTPSTTTTTTTTTTSSSESSSSRPALSSSAEKRKLEDIMGTGEEGFEKRTKTVDST